MCINIQNTSSNAHFNLFSGLVCMLLIQSKDLFSLVCFFLFTVYMQHECIHICVYLYHVCLQRGKDHSYRGRKQKMFHFPSLSLPSNPDNARFYQKYCFKKVKENFSSRWSLQWCYKDNIRKRKQKQMCHFYRDGLFWSKSPNVVSCDIYSNVFRLG